jgi:hypothetical protein
VAKSPATAVADWAVTACDFADAVTRALTDRVGYANPYNFAGLATRMRWRVASSGVQA